MMVYKWKPRVVVPALVLLVIIGWTFAGILLGTLLEQNRVADAANSGAPLHTYAGEYMVRRVHLLSHVPGLDGYYDGMHKP